MKRVLKDKVTVISDGMKKITKSILQIFNGVQFQHLGFMDFQLIYMNPTSFIVTVNGLMIYN